MRGVTTQFSVPKIKIAYSIDRQKRPNVQASASYFPNICDCLAQLRCAFRGVSITDGQSLSIVARIRPRYLKYVTVSSGRM